ncbi:unnamed protein product, partial [Gadus morhua 'NCC']
LFSLCIGLVSTVLGGMLAGQMVVVTAQILETVGEDGPLMEALSAALLGVIQGLITVQIPWFLLGAVMGVAGAAGLALSAGRAAADRYGWPGTVGAVLGAGVGAFVGSLSHGGVSSVTKDQVYDSGLWSRGRQLGCCGPLTTGTGVASWGSEAQEKDGSRHSWSREAEARPRRSVSGRLAERRADD